MNNQEPLKRYKVDNPKIHRSINKNPETGRMFKTMVYCPGCKKKREVLYAEGIHEQPQTMWEKRPRNEEYCIVLDCRHVIEGEITWLGHPATESPESDGIKGEWPGESGPTKKPIRQSK
jgi:hypothetical protein